MCCAVSFALSNAEWVPTARFRREGYLQLKKWQSIVAVSSKNVPCCTPSVFYVFTSMLYLSMD